jgi:hypothetical protein
LTLIAGEDLTPYRDASDALLHAFQSAIAEEGYSAGECPVERGGLDEFVADLTALSRAELARDSAAVSEWAPGARVHFARDGTRSAEDEAGRDRTYRPQDLRALQSSAAAALPSSSSSSVLELGVDRLFVAGSRVAWRLMQEALKATGLTCSVGIAANRMLAKLVAGLHKPQGLTVLPEAQGRAFLSPLPVASLDGVGRAVQLRLAAACGPSPAASFGVAGGGSAVGATKMPVPPLTCAELGDALLAHPLVAAASCARAQRSAEPAVVAAASGVLARILEGLPRAAATARALALAVLAGECDRPVVASAGGPKSVGREDSFMPVSTHAALE